MINIRKRFPNLSGSDQSHPACWPRLGLALVALASLLGPCTALMKGQENNQDAVGIPPLTTALPVENGFINLLNGDLHLEIPLGSYPERAGSQFKAVLMYDSNLWAQDPVGFYYPFNVPDGNGQVGGNSLYAGWRLVTSAHTGRVSPR